MSILDNFEHNYENATTPTKKFKDKTNNKDSQILPQLNHTGGKVRYVPPSVATDYQDRDPSVGIPGAVFVEKEVIKQGVVVSWTDGVGLIKNVENKEEK